MTKNTQPSVLSAKSVELLDLLPRIMLFPGEDKASFEDLRESFMIDLAPGTPYETALVENLVTLEWEAVRHRIMRDSHIREKFRAIATGVFQKMKFHHLQSLYKNARPPWNCLPLFFHLISSNAV